MSTEAADFEPKSIMVTGGAGTYHQWESHGIAPTDDRRIILRFFSLTHDIVFSPCSDIIMIYLQVSLPRTWPSSSAPSTRSTKLWCTTIWIIAPVWPTWKNWRICPTLNLSRGTLLLPIWSRMCCAKKRSTPLCILQRKPTWTIRSETPLPLLKPTFTGPMCSWNLPKIAPPSNDSFTSPLMKFTEKEKISTPIPCRKNTSWNPPTPMQLPKRERNFWSNRTFDLSNYPA